MKRKIALIITAAVMLIATIIGGTLASLQAQTSADQKITTSTAGIELTQKSNSSKAKDTAKGFEVENLMPGDVIDDTVKVKNAGNIPVYIRVTVEKSWMDPATDKKVFEVANGKDADGKDIMAAIDANQIRVDSQKQDDDWISYAGDEYGEVLHYYYRWPVKVGETKELPISAFSILKENKDSNPYSGLSVSVEFDANAVQSGNAKVSQDAILAEWGMTAEINADGGYINSMEEQQ